MKITRHLGSPPHLNSSALDSPHEREESVARTTFGPGYERSNSLTEVTSLKGASCVCVEGGGGGSHGEGTGGAD